jgi:hypothetical protein
MRIDDPLMIERRIEVYFCGGGDARQLRMKRRNRCYSLILVMRRRTSGGSDRVIERERWLLL